MDIASLYNLFSINKKVTTDSRSIEKGTIYFALRGERFDGNIFAARALESGAELAVIDNKDYYINSKTILVEDALATLQALATYHRRVLGIPIFAITGTNGKTTTKELLRSVLSKKYSVVATQGNLNNHIGVPLTILSMTTKTELGIVEMGANHPNEIWQLCEIAEPNFGMITNIGKAHLEGFGGFEGVIKTKNELYLYLNANNGQVFYNYNNNLLAKLLEKMLPEKKICFGDGTNCNCSGKSVPGEMFMGVEILDGTLIKTKLVGDYNLENVMAAVCVGLHFGVTLNDIKNAIESYEPSNKRSQLLETGKNKILLDCYNANPTSTEAALTNFEKISVNEKKVVILGDMLELGDEAEFEHQQIINKLSEYRDVLIFLVGPWYHKLAEGFGIKSFINAVELKECLRVNPISHSFILIKGSRGIQLEGILDEL